MAIARFDISKSLMGTGKSFESFFAMKNDHNSRNMIIEIKMKSNMIRD